MNISKPTEFKHNIHGRLDPSTGNVVHCPIKLVPENNLNISGPTDFKHHVHGTIDRDTGKLVFKNPILNRSLSESSEYDNWDCESCQKLEEQLKQSRKQISQAEEENLIMYATIASLSSYACQVYENGFCENRFKFLIHDRNAHLTKFEENVAHTVGFLMEIKRGKLYAEQNVDKMQMLVQELNKEINLLETKKQHKEEIIRIAQRKMKADKQEFDSRVERAEKELKLLKPYINDLQQENEQLRRKITNLKILFTEWNGTSARISGALYHETSVLEIKKENECLMRKIKELDINRNRLDEEVSSRMDELLRSRENKTPYQNGMDPDVFYVPQRYHTRYITITIGLLNVFLNIIYHCSIAIKFRNQQGSSKAEMNTAERQDNEQLDDNRCESRNQVVHITAKTVNMIEKSNISYGQDGDVTDSEEETLI